MSPTPNGNGLTWDPENGYLVVCDDRTSTLYTFDWKSEQTLGTLPSDFADNNASFLFELDRSGAVVRRMPIPFPAGTDGIIVGPYTGDLVALDGDRPNGDDPPTDLLISFDRSRRRVAVVTPLQPLLRARVGDGGLATDGHHVFVLSSSINGFAPRIHVLVPAEGDLLGSGPTRPRAPRLPPRPRRGPAVLMFAALVLLMAGGGLLLRPLRT